MNRKPPRTPTRKREFLRTRSLVTLWSQHAGPRKCPISNIPLPSLQFSLLYYLALWGRSLPLDHHDPYVPAFPKAILREEEWKKKGIRLQEEPREEAPPKEEEEIRLEFLEMFQEGGGPNSLVRTPPTRRKFFSNSKKQSHHSSVMSSSEQILCVFPREKCLSTRTSPLRAELTTLLNRAEALFTKWNYLLSLLSQPPLLLYLAASRSPKRTSFPGTSGSFFLPSNW